MYTIRVNTLPMHMRALNRILLHLNLMMIEPGLLYKDIEEGTGVIPQPGQKIKAHCKRSTEYSPNV